MLLGTARNIPTLEEAEIKPEQGKYSTIRLFVILNMLAIKVSKTGACNKSALWMVLLFVRHEIICYCRKQ